MYACVGSAQSFRQRTHTLIICFACSKYVYYQGKINCGFNLPRLYVNGIRYVIVIAWVPGIYGSKRTESEGEARGQGLFTLP